MIIRARKRKKFGENDVSDLLKCVLEAFQDVSCNGMLTQGTHGNCKR
jgi:hypothetical protein